MIDPGSIDAQNAPGEDRVRIVLPRALMLSTNETKYVRIMDVTRENAEALFMTLGDALLAQEPLPLPEPTPEPAEPVDGHESPRCRHCGVSIVADTVSPTGWRHEVTRFTLCNPQESTNLDRAEL